MHTQSCPTLCYSMDCNTSRFLWFSRQDYWSGLPFPSPGNLPDPGIKLTSPTSAGGFFTTEPPESESVSCSIVSDFLWPQGLWPSRPLCPWNSPGKNTGVGCHSLLQQIFPIQGLNLGLLQWQADSLQSDLPGKHLSHLGNLKKRLRIKYTFNRERL